MSVAEIRTNGFLYTGVIASTEDEEAMASAIHLPIIKVGTFVFEPAQFVHSLALKAGLPEIRGYYGYDFEAHQFIRLPDADKEEPDAW